MDHKTEQQDRIIQHLEKLDGRLNTMDETLVRNTISLEHHVARTDKLEDYIKAELLPIKNKVQAFTWGVKGIVWFCGIVAGVAGFIWTLAQLGLIRI